MPTSYRHDSDTSADKFLDEAVIPTPTRAVQPAISTRPALKRSASDAALDLTPTEDEIRRPDLKRARVDPSSDTDECIPAADSKVTHSCDLPSLVEARALPSLASVKKDDLSRNPLVKVAKEDRSAPRLDVEAIETGPAQQPTQSECSFTGPPSETKSQNINTHDKCPPVESDREAQTKAASTTDEQQKKRPLLLPLELHDLILEHYWDHSTISCGGLGYHAVRNCRKVCSRWNAAARPHFFREIVLDDPKRLTGLISLIQDEPDIARWIRKIELRGITEPLYPFGIRQPDDVEKDHDSWLYQFPLCFSTPLPNVKILELEEFAHVSRRREDCEAFARWIPGLATLTSVEIMSMGQCEMSPNSVAAIIRAFPRLNSLKFYMVDFARPNVAILVDKSSSPESSKSLLKDGSPDSDRVEYPLLHPSPSLHFFQARNAQDQLIDLNILCNILCPEALSRSLHTLVLGYQVNMRSAAKFISDLGVSPKLGYLQIHVGWYRNFFVDCKVDISTLTNLKDLVLLSDHTSSTEISLNCRQLLSQVDATHLKTVTLIVYYDKKYILKQLDGIDADLAQEKFSKLETVFVKLINTAYSTDPLEKRKRLVKQLRRKVKRLLPLTTGRGILLVSAWYGQS